MDANRQIDDDDLLTPSLSAHDDAVGFDRPWSPNFLVLVGAFFGFVPMGLLLAENFKRLGKPEAFKPTLIATLVIGLTLITAASYAHVYGIQGVYEVGNVEHRRAFRLFHQGLAIAAGLAIAHQQRPRWEIHTGHGGDSGPLFKYALGAIAAGYLLQILVALPFAALKMKGVAL